MSRKWICIFMAAVLAISLTACGKSTSSRKPTSTAENIMSFFNPDEDEGNSSSSSSSSSSGGSSIDSSYGSSSDSLVPENEDYSTSASIEPEYDDSVDWDEWAEPENGGPEDLTPEVVDLPKIDFDWSMYSGEAILPDGYKVEITYTISPWINCTKLDVARAYWANATDTPFPELNSFPLGQFYGREPYTSMDPSDLYVTVGYTIFANSTGDGWEIPQGMTSEIEPMPIGIKYREDNRVHMMAAQPSENEIDYFTFDSYAQARQWHTGLPCYVELEPEVTGPLAFMVIVDNGIGRTPADNNPKYDMGDLELKFFFNPDDEAIFTLPVIE